VLIGVLLGGASASEAKLLSLTTGFFGDPDLTGAGAANLGRGSRPAGGYAPRLLAP
jgi:hypothetical protein